MLTSPLHKVISLSGKYFFQIITFQGRCRNWIHGVQRLSKGKKHPVGSGDEAPRRRRKRRHRDNQQEPRRSDDSGVGNALSRCHRGSSGSRIQLQRVPGVSQEVETQDVLLRHPNLESDGKDFASYKSQFRPGAFWPENRDFCPIFQAVFSQGKRIFPTDLPGEPEYICCIHYTHTRHHWQSETDLFVPPQHLSPNQYLPKYFQLPG